MFFLSSRLPTLKDNLFKELSNKYNVIYSLTIRSLCRESYNVMCIVRKQWLDYTIYINSYVHICT